MGLSTDTQETLTEADKAALESLRKRGFAVCVFTPGEMPHSDPDDVEIGMCQAGWNQINFDAPPGSSISL